MCGIIGIFHRGCHAWQQDLKVAAQNMVASLIHRGPDAGGIWSDAEAGIALGHRRLAIIDLSPTGQQPMLSQNGRWVIVFNGEIYNFIEIRSRLAREGVSFRGRSDTEVLLEAVATWGVYKTLSATNGMFAFALWDRQTRTLTLARDRLGEKPLYYATCNGNVLFGSELKALRQHPSFLAEMDREALVLYLRFGYIPAPYSIYRNVKKLPPGTSLQIESTSSDSFVPIPYWSLAEAIDAGAEHRKRASVTEAADELEPLLMDAVRLRMESDVPLGAFLSGGIDSSLVTAFMQRNSSQPIRTFTIGFQEPAFDEAGFSKKVAQHLGTDHTELYVTPEQALAVVPMLPNLFDEPFSDSSAIPTFLVSTLARSQVTVALSGDGGDELFSGYTRYRIAELQWLRTLPKSLRKILTRCIQRFSPTAWDQLAAQLPKLLRTKNIGEKLYKLEIIANAASIEDAYRKLVSFWDQPTTLADQTQEPDCPFQTALQYQALCEPMHRMMYADTVSYLPDDILAKVDRASMAVSLESRIPLLDHRIVEYAWRLPLETKFSDGVGKRVLRTLLERHVPSSLIERPKMGFGIPLAAWLRGPLRPWAEDLLSARRLHDMGLVDVATVRCHWEEHLSGRRNWQHHLWIILSLVAWYERWMNGFSAEAIGTSDRGMISH